jgi:hypothetical protein
MALLPERYNDDQNTFDIYIVKDAEVANPQFPCCQWVVFQVFAFARWLIRLIAKLNVYSINDYLLISFSKRFELFSSTREELNGEGAHLPLRYSGK